MSRHQRYRIGGQRRCEVLTDLLETQDDEALIGIV
jgi:hypothetical protein